MTASVMLAVCDTAIGADGEPAKRMEGPTYPFRRVVVLAIGVEKFPSLRGGNLGDATFAERDAESVATTLSERFGYETFPVLTGSNATRANIKQQLRMLDNLTGEDALIVFIATHGIRRVEPLFGETGFFLCHDTKLNLDTQEPLDMYKDQTLEMRDFVANLSSMAVGHVVVFADTCVSGLARPRGEGDLPRVSQSLGEALRRSSRTVITATTSDQYARPHSKHPHGIFTFCLLEQLRTEAVLPINHLYSNLYERVGAESQANMMPQLITVGSGGGTFAFIPRSFDRSKLPQSLKDEKFNELHSVLLNELAERQVKRHNIPRRTLDPASALRKMLAHVEPVPALRQQGKHAEAAALYREAVELAEAWIADLDAADERFELARKMMPDLWYNLAVYEYNEKNYVTSMQFALRGAKAFDMLPQSEKLKKSTQWFGMSLHKARGRSLWELKRFADAEYAFEEALLWSNHFPSDTPTMRIDRAYSQARQYKFSQATIEAEAALELASSDAWCNELAARVYSLKAVKARSTEERRAAQARAIVLIVKAGSRMASTRLDETLKDSDFDAIRDQPEIKILRKGK